MTVSCDVMGCGQSTPSSRILVSTKSANDKDDVYRKKKHSDETATQRHTNSNTTDINKVVPKSGKISQNTEKSKRSSAKVGSVTQDDSQSEDMVDTAILDSKLVSRQTAFRDKVGPLLQPQASSVETESLLEFFRVLDEKIEQGQDYVTQS